MAAHKKQPRKPGQPYKVKITKSIASERARKAWETKRKNGTDKPWNKGKKGGTSWNKGLTAKTDARVRKNIEAMANTTRRQFKDGTRKPYKHTPETNRKMALAKMGDKNPMRIYPHLREGSRRTAVRNEVKRNRPPSDIERILRHELEMLDVEYVVNKDLEEMTVPDVYIESLKTAIYADGEYWHDQPRRKKIDSHQDVVLPTLGYYVLRFRGKEIKSPDFPLVLSERIGEIKARRALERGLTQKKD